LGVKKRRLRRFWGLFYSSFPVIIVGYCGPTPNAMMVRTQKAVDALFTSSFKLGGDTSIAVGPVGAGAKSNIVADIISFSRTKGAYAGLSLDGSVISTKDKWNEAYYGKAVSPVDIIVKRSVKALRTSVTKAAAGK